MQQNSSDVLAGMVIYRYLETIMLSPQSEICLEKIDPFMKEEVDGSYLASVV